MILEFLATNHTNEHEQSGGKTMIFLYSYHTGSTRKIAEAIAPVINAPIMNVEAIDPENFDLTALQEYSLIGFGSGIDSARHYRVLLDFAENLPDFPDKKAFIFSTSGIYNKGKMLKDHRVLRTILLNKGFVIVNEFGCLGHNTNSFLKFFGGMNKGRPNSIDLRNAELFAEELLLNRGDS